MLRQRLPISNGAKLAKNMAECKKSHLATNAVKYEGCSSISFLTLKPVIKKYHGMAIKDAKVYQRNKNRAAEVMVGNSSPVNTKVTPT